MNMSNISTRTSKDCAAYPINHRYFQRLHSERSRMVGSDSAYSGMFVAAPFLPWVGPQILSGRPGIYFVGIATRGRWTDESADFDESRKRSEEAVKSSNTQWPFWRYMNEMTGHVLGRDYWHCADRIGWSNQFKIGVFDKFSKTGNPYGDYSATQAPLCATLLRRELLAVGASAVLLLGGGGWPVINDVFRSCWDEKTFAELGFWQRRWRNALILWQNHPGYVLRRGQRHWRAHIDATASALRRHLKIN